MERRELEFIMRFPRVAYLSMRKMVHGFKTSQTDLSLNDTQQRTLMLLADKGPQTMTQLHHAIGLEKGSLTAVIDRLIELKFAERKSVIGDRRKVKIELTPMGAQKTARLQVEIAEFIGAKLQKLSAADRERFYEAVEVLSEISKKL